MQRIAVLVVTAAVGLPALQGHARAADLGEPPPIATIQPDQRAFYVRGDFGYAFNKIGELSQPDVIDNGGKFVAEDFGNAPYIGAGIGWRFSRWLRFDLTGEYRFSSDVSATDLVEQRLHNPNGDMRASTTYSGEHTAFVGLANAYIDLPKLNGVTPYVGGGIGFARNRFSDFTTASIGSFTDDNGHVDQQTTHGYANDKSETSFAWALMAGLGIDVNDRTTLDVGYRYVHLGSSVAVSTDLINCECGTVASPLTGNDLESHEFRVGLRIELGEPAQVAAPLK